MDILNFFRPENIAAHLTSMSDLASPVMDTVFKDRVQIPFAYVGKEDILAVTKEMPFVMRGAQSIPTNPMGIDVSFFEPLPVRIHDSVYAQELNNLKQLKPESTKIWVANRIDTLRRIYRRTTEAICASALGGTLEWPVYVDGGPDNWVPYRAEYGEILSHIPETLWSAEKVAIADVFRCLRSMKKSIQANGFGATLEIWAGDDAFDALLSIAESAPAKSKVPMEFNEQGVSVAGFLVKSRAESYTNPKTGETIPVVPANTVRMIATDANHRLAYCAVDDLDANLQALPFFVKPIQTKDPSGLTLVGEGKPFPIVNVKGICDAVVVAGE